MFATNKHCVCACVCVCVCVKSTKSCCLHKCLYSAYKQIFHRVDSWPDEEGAASENLLVRKDKNFVKTTGFRRLYKTLTHFIIFVPCKHVSPSLEKDLHDPETRAESWFREGPSRSRESVWVARPRRSSCQGMRNQLAHNQLFKVWPQQCPICTVTLPALAFGILPPKLVGVLSPVNHQGCLQGWKQTRIHLLLIPLSVTLHTSHSTPTTIFLQYIQNNAGGRILETEAWTFQNSDFSPGDGCLWSRAYWWRICELRHKHAQYKIKWKSAHTHSPILKKENTVVQ